MAEGTHLPVGEVENCFRLSFAYGQMAPVEARLPGARDAAAAALLAALTMAMLWPMLLVAIIQFIALARTWIPEKRKSSTTTTTTTSTVCGAGKQGGRLGVQAKRQRALINQRALFARVSSSLGRAPPRRPKGATGERRAHGTRSSERASGGCDGARLLVALETPLKRWPYECAESAAA